MKTILTGATGFLGKYIEQELAKISKVFTLSRFGGSISADLSKEVPQLPSVDLVVHCAGKAHSVPKTDAEKQAFFDVNFKGTANLLKGLELLPNLPKSFVFISTVAVYGVESGTMINEENSLNASDPYGQSKILAELMVREWCTRNNIICSILRLPLLVGENPPGNLGAMITGIQRGYYFNIAGGKAKKSMVLVMDVAKVISIVAKIGGIYNLTDGKHPSFKQLADLIAKQLGKSNITNLPLWLASTMAMIGNILGSKAPINKKKLDKITSDLTFDDSKAKKELNWKPNPVLYGFKIK